MKTTYIIRTQTLKIVKHKDPLFQTIDDLSFKAKNIYNSALYICRQHYFKYNQIPSYLDLNSFHKDLYTEDYKSLPSGTTQQILMLTQRTMKSFINASKDFYNNPQKYKAKPRLPKYKHKTTGRCILIFTNQQIRFKEGYIHFPASTNIPPLKTHLNLETPEQDEFSFSKAVESPIRQVRIIPLLNSYRIEIVYNKEIQVPNKPGTNVASIDLGINNFATVVTYGSQSYRPLILNGKGLKSYNKNFNKKLAALQSTAKQSNNKYSTKAIQALYSKRNRVFNDFYHKASSSIVKYLLQNQVSILVIGYNKQWKQNSKLSKNVNQTFIQIGFQIFINLLTYKCQEHQIKVILQEESYTSGTSFLDNEPTTKDFYNKSRRIHRGLFKHSNTTNFKYPYINADINSAFQILSKATNNKLSYNSRFIKQQSITPIVINLDTFNHRTKQQAV
jgi:putative transposase